MTVNTIARTIAKQLLPEALVYSLRMWAAAKQEPLLSQVLPILNGGVAVDIGANVGVYSHAFSRRARRTVAFEPLPDLAKQLGRLNPRVEVHACALSNTSGQFTLYIPFLDGQAIQSRASLNSNANPGFETKALDFPVRRLDDFALDDVRVIKIDVEGHEWNTLEGAQETIQRFKPILVVEIEERHHPGESWNLIHWIEGLGYQGFYASAKGIKEIDGFDFATMQDIANIKTPFGPSSGEYINNFLFRA